MNLSLMSDNFELMMSNTQKQASLLEQFEYILQMDSSIKEVASMAFKAVDEDGSGELDK